METKVLSFFGNCLSHHGVLVTRHFPGHPVVRACSLPVRRMGRDTVSCGAQDSAGPADDEEPLSGRSEVAGFSRKDFQRTRAQAALNSPVQQLIQATSGGHLQEMSTCFCLASFLVSKASSLRNDLKSLLCSAHSQFMHKEMH
jgi:hypothetical protein